VEQKPFLGYGLENINTAYADYFTVNKHALFEINAMQTSVMYRLKDLMADRSHNYALDLLLFSGILGFLSWGVLVCLMIKKARQKEILLGLLFYLIWSSFQNQSVVNLLYFWLLAGIIDQEEISGS